MTEKQKNQNQYRKKRVKRIPLDVSPEFYEATKEAAAASGQSVNGFIKRAIIETAERDKQSKS